MTDKIHVVVRRDLPFGPQIAQAVHAMKELGRGRSDPDFVETEHVVILHARDEAHLTEVHERLVAEPGALVKAFHEPDYDGAMTAVAAWRSGKVLSSLPLARMCGHNMVEVDAA